MILESHIDEKSILPIDCESDTGLNKGGVRSGAHPDRVLENMGRIIALMHRELGKVATSAGVKDAEVEFGLKVDLGANVSVAQKPTEGQVRIKIRL